MLWKNKRVVVVGAGKSGAAAARLLCDLGAQVSISESRPREAVDGSIYEWIQAQQISAEFGRHRREFISENDLMIISPGIPPTALPLQWAREIGMPVWGEIELAFRLCPCRVIAVTGSNGKTTVTTLIGEMLRAAGRRVHIGGNIGTPFCSLIPGIAGSDLGVLEVSSFQLMSTEAFKPWVAVLLNISENHLDWHANFDAYQDAKQRMFARQDEDDYAILNGADPRLRDLAGRLRARVIFFDENDGTAAGSEDPNFQAAFAAARIAGVPANICQRVWEGFRGVPHRLEFVMTIDGVDYVNDSKATTAEAVRWALQHINKPVVLICGGRDKQIDFSVLVHAMRERVKGIVALGEAREKIRQTFASVTTVTEAESLAAALAQARRMAQAGDCVLLSPMCASFDMFRNYEDRGEQFKDLVNRLSQQ